MGARGSRLMPTAKHSIEFEDLKSRLYSLHHGLQMSWRAIYALPEFEEFRKVSKNGYAQLNRFLNLDEEPTDIHQRLALGLPAQKLVNICPIHKVDHGYDCRTQEVRPKRKVYQKPKNIQDMSMNELRWCLENRTEMEELDV